MRLDSFWSRAANRQVARAAGVVASVAILVKLVATVKEFAVAGLYGRSDAMDAFLAASLVPALLVNLISESMNQALIPTLARVRAQQGLARAQHITIHDGLAYDLTVDTSRADPATCARAILERLASGRPPEAMDELRRRFQG